MGGYPAEWSLTAAMGWRRSGAPSASERSTETSVAPRPGTCSSQPLRITWPQSSLRPRATGRRVMSGDWRRSGLGCGSRPLAPRNPTNGVGGDVKKVSCDSCLPGLED